MAKFVKVHVAAAHFGVSVWTIRRWIEEGKLVAEKDPGGRCWRVDIESKPKAGEAPDAPDDSPAQTSSGRRVLSRGVQI